MNGGTNIAAAIHRAGQLLRNSSESCRRVLCLMTDGRVDRYQVCVGVDTAQYVMYTCIGYMIVCVCVLQHAHVSAIHTPFENTSTNTL